MGTQRWICLLVLLAGACDTFGRSDQQVSGAAVTVLEELAGLDLQESDTLYVGRPLGLVMGAEDIWVGDAFGKRLLRFDREGRALGVYGGPGDGPGEFRLAGVAIAVHGDVVMMADDGDKTLESFDIRTGSWLGSTPVGAAMGPVSSHRGTHTVGVMSWESPSAVLQWSGVDVGAAKRFGHYPPGYRETPPLAGIFNRTTAFQGSGDTLVYLPGAADRGYLSIQGGVVDSFAVPVARRHGAPVSLPEGFDVNQDLRAFLARTSGLFAGATLPSGRIALVHLDQAYREDALFAKAFLTVFRRGSEGGCIDVPIPTLADGPPRVAFRGDTLFVFELVLDADSSVAQSRLRSFKVRDDAC